MTKRRKDSASAQLRAYLKRERLTQSAFAAELGISNSHLSELLSEQTTPSLSLAARIENVTGIPAREFAEQVA